MAPKVMKKSTKPPMEKPIDKVISKTKKQKKKNYTSFSIYLFKLLRSVNVGKEYNLGISRHSMLIMNNFVNDMLEKIATEAGRLAFYGKKNTMGSAEIQSATKLLLPGELAKHANAQGVNAIAKYVRSQES
ncbi:late histone H2B.L4-like [Pararge aegeria]|uniref:Jg22398 protein n=1 Tax=Pararge aegeria aegeria TaxID=348720 RepID=A0A8S4SAM9_9NEOP|nr:late histone H2B.L4-like [Pararge aegeria]CAH2245015.1 jg22398 [Pararge aegeria aegeria]